MNKRICSFCGEEAGECATCGIFLGEKRWIWCSPTGAPEHYCSEGHSRHSSGMPLSPRKSEVI